MKNFFKYHRNSCLVFVITLTVFSSVSIYHLSIFETGFPFIGDQSRYIMLTYMIVRHQSVLIDEFFLDENPDPILQKLAETERRKQLLDESNFFGTYERDDGHRVLFHSPGLSYLLIPGYFIGNNFGAMMTISVVSSFTSVIIYTFTTKFTTPKIGFLTVMVFSFATLLLPYSDLIYSDVAITLFLITSLYIIFEKNKNPVLMAIAGILTGYGIFLKITFLTFDVVLIPAIILLFFSHKISKKNCLIFLAFFAILSSLAIINNVYTYHDWRGGYNTVNSLNVLLTGESEGRFKHDSQWADDAAIEIFFGKYHGIFIFSPIVMLFVLGIRRFWDTNRFLLITCVFLSLFFLIGHLLAFPVFSLGGLPPYRYFIPLIPIMAIPFAMGFEKYSKNHIYRAFFFVLLIPSFAWSMTAVIYKMTSIGHRGIKTQAMNSIWMGLDSFFPSLGPSRIPEWHHPLTLENTIFLIVMVILLSIGIIIPFIKKQKVSI